MKCSTEPRQGRSGRDVNRHVPACCFPVGAHSFTNWPLVSSVIHCSGTGLQAGNQLPELGQLISLPHAFHFPSSCFSHHYIHIQNTSGQGLFPNTAIKQAFISTDISSYTRIQTTVGLFAACGANTKSIKTTFNPLTTQSDYKAQQSRTASGFKTHSTVQWHKRALGTGKLLARHLKEEHGGVCINASISNHLCPNHNSLYVDSLKPK